MSTDEAVLGESSKQKDRGSRKGQGTGLYPVGQREAMAFPD